MILISILYIASQPSILHEVAKSNLCEYINFSVFDFKFPNDEQRIILTIILNFDIHLILMCQNLKS